MADTGKNKMKFRKTGRRVSVLTPASPALERCASNVAVTLAAVRRTWETVDIYRVVFLLVRPKSDPQEIQTLKMF